MGRESLKNAIELGDMDEVLEIAERFLDLPEFGMVHLLEQVRAQVEHARRLEGLAREARNKARNAALVLLDEARKNWTASEIRKSTGYPVGR